MRSLVFPLALLLPVLVIGAACGSSSKKSDAKTAGASTATSDDSFLVAVYEIREKDGGQQVGTVYKRNHRNGRLIYWVHDAKGTRRGYITMDNRAFAYEYLAGERSDRAYPVGEDTITANARMVIGYGRAVVLEEIDLDTWARKGTIHEQGSGAAQPAGSDGDE